VEIDKLRPSSRTLREHLGIRAAAWGRRIGAERQIGRMASGMRKDLHAARRDARTSVAVGRSKLTVAVARSLEDALARLARRPGTSTSPTPSPTGRTRRSWTS
jgi:hypothetical protein